MNVASDQLKLQRYRDFQTIEADIQTLRKDANVLAINRQKLFTQLHENKMVETELKLVTSDSKVYKLISSVLVAQDQREALSNVEKRISFISNELAKLEKSLAVNQQKQDESIQKLNQIQQWFLQQQQLESQAGGNVQQGSAAVAALGGIKKN